MVKHFIIRRTVLLAEDRQNRKLFTNYEVPSQFVTHGALYDIYGQSLGSTGLLSPPINISLVLRES